MARATKADAPSVTAEAGEVREDQPTPLVAVAAGETATDPAGESDVGPTEGQGPAVADVAAAASVLADSASKAASPAFARTVDDEVPEEGDVELVMLLTISGLRNGEPWPRAGRVVTLPAAEAASLVANGYAALAE